MNMTLESENIRLRAKNAELEAEVERLLAEKAILRAELAESEGFLGVIQSALNGKQPSDFMRSFTAVEHAWQIFRLAYPALRGEEK